MNWVDAFIIAILLLFGFEGWNKSLLGELLNLGSFFLALIASLRFWAPLASLLQSRWQLPLAWANLGAFILIWVLVEVGLYLLIVILFQSFLSKLKLPGWSRHLSAIPALLRGVIFVSLILVIAATFPIQPSIKQAVHNSLIGSFLLGKTQQLEEPVKAIFGGISQDSLNFFTIEPKTGESLNLGFKTNNYSPNPSLENQMIQLVNQERTSRNIPPLTFDPSLRTIARVQSADMFSRGYFSHYSPEGKSVADRADAAGIPYEVIGENLAYAPDLLSAHRGLMNSPGHRANILSPQFHKIGIGIEDGGVYGLMITQDFSN